MNRIPTAVVISWLLLLLISCSKPCDSFCTNVAAATRHHRDLYSLNAVSTEYNEQDRFVNTAINDFISTVVSKLHDKTFESFTLKGPSAPRKKRGGGNKNKSSTNTEEIKIERQKEALRGKYKTILGRLVFLQDKKKRRKKKGGGDDSAGAELDSGSLYLQVTIKYHLATDIVQNWGIESDMIEVESGLRSIFATALGNNSRNYSAVPLSEWGATTNEKGEIDIRAGELITSDGVYELQLHGKNTKFRESKKKKNKEQRQSQLMNDPTQLSHDRTKKVPLSTSSQFFQKLGVTNSDGKPMSGMASKLRQCQKFV